MLKVILLTTVMVLWAKSLDCPLPLNQRGSIISGSVGISPNQQQRQQDLTYKTFYDSPLSQTPQLCLSLTGYEDTNTGYIKFTTNPQNVSQLSFILRLTSPDICAWQKVTINYLASTKPQIQINSITNIRPMYNQDQAIILFYSPSIYMNKDIKVRTFLSAIDIQANSGNSIVLNFVKIQIKSSGIQISYSSPGCNIYAISVGIVVFDNSSPGIMYVQGMVQQNELASQAQMKIDKSSLDTLQTYIIGINSLNAQERAGIKINLDFTSTLSLFIQSSTLKSAKINYLIISIVNCGSCTGYPLFYQNRCYNNCPIKTVYRNGVCVAMDCSNGYQFNADGVCVPICGVNQVYSGKSCVCGQGFYLVNGQCQQCGVYDYKNGKCGVGCGQNAQYSAMDGKCYCLSGYVIVQGACALCPKGTKYDISKEACTTERDQYSCKDNEVYAMGQCLCASGFYRINEVCQKCPDYSSYSFDNGNCRCDQGYILSGIKCVRSCSTVETLYNNQCVCIYGFTRNQNGLCIPNCQDNENWNGSACLCTGGFMRNSFGVCAPYCRPKQILNINNLCICQDGYQRDNQGQCNIPICKTNQVSLNGQCVCQNGYNKNAYGFCVIMCKQNEILQNEQCICSNNYIRNNNGLCSLNCNQNQFEDYGKCLCKNGFKRNMYGLCDINCNTNQIFFNGQCNCQNGFVKNIMGICVYNVNICGVNQVLSGNICVCFKGFSRRNNNVCNPIICTADTILNDQDVCVSRCTSNTYWDSFTQSCRQSVVCPANSQWNGQNCQCISGYYFSNNMCVFSCPSGQSWDSNLVRCVNNCPLGRLLINGACICPVGTWENGGSCTSCKVNEQLVHGICVCVQGLYLINGVCGQCQKDSVWNFKLSSCIYNCPNGQQWKISSQSCVSNICPSSYYWNIILQACQAANGICPQSLVWNGKKCVCSPGYIYNNAGGCRKNCSGPQLPNDECSCPDGQKINMHGVCTNICNNGFSFHNGQCKTSICGNGEVWDGYQCGCKPNYERYAPNVCLPGCAVTETRVGNKCECKSGYQRSGNDCIPNNDHCPYPHQFVSGNCICASGFEKYNGACVSVCQAGYVRSSLGYCDMDCANDKILADGKCVCRVGLNNVNGLCQKCPQFAYENSGSCYCTMNNYPVSNGQTCPMLGSCTDPNSIWDNVLGACVCSQQAMWIYGKCQNPQICGTGSTWNGIQCACLHGYTKVGEICQVVGQNYYCPSNSKFNGLNCQCLSGFYPVNANSCQRCPSQTYWTGNKCSSGSGSCLNSLVWDGRGSCVYPNKCQANQEWNGFSCVCSYGSFFIDGKCKTCPAGTVFDGLKCNRGRNSQCKGPYSYFNGYTCTCIPGYWQLGDGCVTCPSGYQWSGISCRSASGFLRSLKNSDNPLLSFAVQATIR